MCKALLTWVLMSRGENNVYGYNWREQKIIKRKEFYKVQIAHVSNIWAIWTYTDRSTAPIPAKYSRQIAVMSRL
jgi:hypothetical protein